VVKHFESERNSERINIELLDDEKTDKNNESPEKNESKLEKSE